MPERRQTLPLPPPAPLPMLQTPRPALPTPRPTLQTLATVASARPTPAGVTSFIMNTPTPMMRPLAPPVLPSRPAHRPPLLSPTERIERLCLQWLSIAAVGFVCGVLWHEHHMTDEFATAAGAEANQPRPEIVAIANDQVPANGGEPVIEAPTASAPGPMIIQAQISHPAGARSPRSWTRGSLRASARRTHAIR
jgi:hypothetical protein